MSNFKVGDEVIRLPPHSQNWPDKTWIVAELTFFIAFPNSEAILLEGDASKYNPEYFELASVFNSPLYQALK